LWDVTTGGQILTTQGHSYSVVSVAFSPDGKTFASGGCGDIKLWNVGTATEIYTLKGHSDWVRSVAFSPDGKILASGSNDKIINIWQVASSSNTAASSPIKPTQSNVPQAATFTPHTQPVITQPSVTPSTTTTLNTGIKVLVVVIVGIGLFFYLVGWFVMLPFVLHCFCFVMLRIYALTRT
jgi:WD40 repeat protein